MKLALRENATAERNRDRSSCCLDLSLCRVGANTSLCNEFPALCEEFPGLCKELVPLCQESSGVLSGVPSSFCLDLARRATSR